MYRARVCVAAAAAVVLALAPNSSSAAQAVASPMSRYSECAQGSANRSQVAAACAAGFFSSFLGLIGPQSMVDAKPGKRGSDDFEFVGPMHSIYGGFVRNSQIQSAPAFFDRPTMDLF